MQVTFGKRVYNKTKFSDLSGKTIVRLAEDVAEPRNWVEARGDGMTVVIHRDVSTNDEAGDFMAELRELLLMGRKEWDALRPKFHTTLSGH